MHLLHGIDALAGLPRGSALSVGNFDGLHLGHRAILERLRSLSATVAVVTFEPHPVTVLRPGHAPPRLCSAARRRELLAEAGVTHLIELAPEPAVLGLSAESFFALLRDAGPAHIVEGHDFNFGRGRSGSVDLMRQWAQGSGITVEIQSAVTAALCDLTVCPVSSSVIRWLLLQGRIRDANRCLGRPIELEGLVVEGYRRGATLGFPTANLRPEADAIVPGPGVYAAECTIAGRAHAVALSIGSTPTFDGARLQIEAHLLDFSGDLYGQMLRLRLIDWVRAQRRFAGVEELKRQLTRDVNQCRTAPALARHPLLQEAR